jgi:hypothetical protein
MPTGRRLGLARCLLLVIACAPAGTGCRTKAPTQLANGAAARASPVALETVDQATVATEVDVVPIDRIESDAAFARCVRRIATDAPIEDVVVRIGVVAESVTVASASGRALYACDGRRSPGGAGRSDWCGTAFGRLERGHLVDPRLDLVDCAATGEPLAFAWVEPGRSARYVALRQPGYVEVYEVKGRLPVRVATTTGVDVDGSRASFELSEHDAGGKLLRAYELEARVAG